MPLQCYLSSLAGTSYVNVLCRVNLAGRRSAPQFAHDPFQNGLSVHVSISLGPVTKKIAITKASMAMRIKSPRRAGVTLHIAPQISQRCINVLPPSGIKTCVQRTWHAPMSPLTRVCCCKLANILHSLYFPSSRGKLRIRPSLMGWCMYKVGPPPPHQLWHF